MIPISITESQYNKVKPLLTRVFAGFFLVTLLGTLSAQKESLRINHQFSNSLKSDIIWVIDHGTYNILEGDINILKKENITANIGTSIGQRNHLSQGDIDGIKHTYQNFYSTNDICDDAIALPVDGTCQIYNNLSATASNNPAYALSCGQRDRDLYDVWFTVTVPSSGNVQIEINELTNGLNDTDMEVYEGTCTSLIPIACNLEKERYSNYSPQARIELEGRSSGEILYVRVTNRSNNEGSFEICASDQAYTHLCKIDLIEVVNQSTCDPQTNTFNQTLKVHYRTDGSPNMLRVNNYNFTITGSPQVVTLLSLPSNENSIVITAELHQNYQGSACRTNTYYYTHNLVQAPPNCYSGTVANDECIGAISLSVQQGCVGEIYNLTGATSSANLNDLFGCYYAGDHPQDIWFSFVMPVSGDVVVNTYYVEFSAIFEVFTGECGSLVLQESCGSDSRSLRITGTVGEQFYIRVADSQGDQQGELGICVFEVEDFTNDICNDAIELPVTSTCIGAIYSDHFANAENNPSSSLSCGNGEDAKDVWFKVVVPASGSILLKTEEVERGRSTVLMEVYEGTCIGLTMIDCNQYGANNSHSLINLSGRTPYEVLYVRVDSRRNDQNAFRICAISIENDICSGAQPLTINTICNPDTVDISKYSASGNPSITLGCDYGQNPSRDAWYEITVPDGSDYIVKTVSFDDNYAGSILELYSGVCGSLVIIDCDRSSRTNGNSQVGFGKLSAGQKLYVRVGTTYNNNQSPFGICVTPARDNNRCAGAITINADGSCVTVSNESSSASNEPVPFLSCGSRRYAADDIWFKVLVPTSGKLKVETNYIEGGLYGSEIEIYQGSCGTLEPIACSENKDRFDNYSSHSRVELQGRNSGETLYIRVVEDNNTKGLLEICVSDIIEYQDPCKIDLIELMDQSACDPQTNTYSQMLKVHYHTDGLSNILSINNQDFLITESPQLVSLINLPSNGNYLDVFGELEQDNQWNNKCRSNSRYYSNNLIQTPFGCYSGTVTNDECINAITLSVEQECAQGIYDLTGATTSTYVNGTFNCYFAGDHPQDVWFTFVMPSSGDVVVNTSYVDIATVFEIYSGDCGSLVLQESCGEAYNNSIRLTGSIGEQYYIRVADNSGNQQGEFGICVFEVEPSTNDICFNAIEIPVSRSCTGKIYSDHFAQHENNPTSSLSCGYGEDAEDVWFKVVVPPSGSLILTTEEVEQAYRRVFMEVYEGTCSGLEMIDCNQYSIINISGRTPSEVLYVRIDSRNYWHYSFSICAISVENDVCLGSKSLDINVVCNPDTVDIFKYNPSGTVMACSYNSEPNRDAWFELTVPDGGDYLVKTTSIDGNYAGSIMELYSGTCGLLSLEICAVENLPNGNTQIPIAGYGSDQKLYIRLGTNGDSDRAQFGICVIPAVDNNRCAEAIPLIVDGSCLLVNNEAATPSNEPSLFLSCGTREIPFHDLWFTVTVPSSGNITIETTEVMDGLNDTEMEAYSGTCGSLQAIACNLIKEGYNAYDPHSRISLEGRNPGEILYVRVGGNYTNRGDFNICATDQGHIHSCKIDLIELFSQSDCDPETNTFNQTLKVHYRADLSQDRLYLLSQEYFLTGSPQLIEVRNLPANANQLGINAELAGNNYNSCQANSFYYSNDFIQAPIGCYNGNIINDECSEAISLEVSSECSEVYYNLTGATTSAKGNRLCRFFGNYSQDVWFSFVMPESGDVIVNTFTSEINTAFNIYTGSCGSLALLEDCGSDDRSKRVNAESGEVIYIKVAEMSGNQQGEFGICVFEVEPSTNDDCVNTIELPVASSCIGAIYSDHYAVTQSGTNYKFDCDTRESCIRDIWFKVTVPSSGNINIKTEEVERGYSNLFMEVYSGTCANRDLIDCVNRNANNGHVSSSLTNRPPNEVLYIRIDSRSCDNNAYRVCATDECPDDVHIRFDIHQDLSLEANGQIRSSSTINSDVEFSAKQGVGLQKQFSVQQGNKLSVDLEGCTNE